MNPLYWQLLSVIAVAGALGATGIVMAVHERILREGAGSLGSLLEELRHVTREGQPLGELLRQWAEAESRAERSRADDLLTEIVRRRSEGETQAEAVKARFLSRLKVVLGAYQAHPP